MLETFQKIWKFAGDERDNINKSIVFCFINAVFGMFEIAAVYLLSLIHILRAHET